jgi:hypothetical protein
VSRLRLIQSLAFLAALSLGQDDVAEATACYRESLQTAADVGSPFGVAIGLASLAEVTRQKNHLARAARLSGATIARGAMDQLALVVPGGCTCPPASWSTIKGSRRYARLGDLAVAQAWVEGQLMALEQAVAYTLQEGEADESPSQQRAECQPQP